MQKTAKKIANSSLMIKKKKAQTILGKRKYAQAIKDSNEPTAKRTRFQIKQKKMGVPINSIKLKKSENSDEKEDNINCHFDLKIKSIADRVEDSIEKKTSYVCLLRGINVGGKRKIKMSDLRDLCKSLNFTSVATYLQSGNVLLTTKLKSDDLAKAFKVEIGKKFGHHDVTILVWTDEGLKDVIEANPFQAPEYDITKVHCTFLATIPTEDAVKKLSSQKLSSFLPEKFKLIGKVVYVYCPRGYGRTKLTNSFFERVLAISATTRNWRTTKTLYDKLSKNDL